MKKKIRKIKKSNFQVLEECGNCETADSLFEFVFGKLFSEMKEKYANCAECPNFKKRQKALEAVQRKYGRKKA